MKYFKNFEKKKSLHGSLEKPLHRVAKLVCIFLNHNNNVQPNSKVFFLYLRCPVEVFRCFTKKKLFHYFFNSFHLYSHTYKGYCYMHVCLLVVRLQPTASCYFVNYICIVLLLL